MKGKKCDTIEIDIEDDDGEKMIVTAQIDNEILKNIPEYLYTYKKVHDPHATKCKYCNIKTRPNRYDLALCDECFNKLVISRNMSMSMNILSSYNWKSIKYFTIERNGHRNKVYLLGDIRLAVIKQEFGIKDPDAQTYKACVDAIKEKYSSIIEAKYIMDKKREKMRADKKKMIDLELKNAGIKIGTYESKQLYNKYIKGRNVSLKNTMDKIIEIEKENNFWQAKYKLQEKKEKMRANKKKMIDTELKNAGIIVADKCTRSTTADMEKKMMMYDKYINSQKVPLKNTINKIIEIEKSVHQKQSAKK